MILRCFSVLFMSHGKYQILQVITLILSYIQLVCCYIIIILLYLILFISKHIIFILMFISCIYCVHCALYSKMPKKSLKEILFFLYNYVKNKSLKEFFFELYNFIKSHIMSFIIILVIANIIRFFLLTTLNINFFQDFISYFFTMFSLIVPTMYISNIIKNILKKKLDFSTCDIKNSITLPFLLFFSINLYISYFYIVPFIIMNSMFFFSFNSLRILNPILVNMHVQDIFDYYLNEPFSIEDINRWTQRYVLSRRDIRDFNNRAPGDIEIYPSVWVKKSEAHNVIKTKFLWLSDNLHAPQIPTNMYDSFFTQEAIQRQINSLHNNPYLIHSIVQNMVHYYFSHKSNFCVINGGIGGHSALSNTRNIPKISQEVFYNGSLKHCSVQIIDKKPSNSNFMQKLIDFVYYDSENQFEGGDFNRSNPKARFYIFAYNTYLIFIELDPNLIGQFRLKVQGLPQGSSPILTKVATRSGIETIRIHDMYGPESVGYDLTREKYWFAIHMLFKYYSIIPQIQYPIENLYSDGFSRLDLDKRLTHMPNNHNTGLGLYLNNNRIEKTNDIFIKKEE